MRTSTSRLALAILTVAASASIAVAQADNMFSAMHWRTIGPTRAGRARALSGVPSQPNVFYVGFDNGPSSSLAPWRTGAVQQNRDRLHRSQVAVAERLGRAFNGRLRDEHLDGQQFDSLLKARVFTEA